MRDLSSVIKYRYYTDIRGGCRVGTTKVKNCMDDIHAKVKLESYLKKHHPTFLRMEVVSCKPFLPGMPDFFNDIFNGFKK